MRQWILINMFMNIKKRCLWDSVSSCHMRSCDSEVLLVLEQNYRLLLVLATCKVPQEVSFLFWNALKITAGTAGMCQSIHATHYSEGSARSSSPHSPTAPIPDRKEWKWLITSDRSGLLLCGASMTELMLHFNID